MVGSRKPERPEQDMRMFYGESPCAEEVSAWVGAHWSFEAAGGAPETEHRIPLTGGATVFVGEGMPPMLTGPRVSPMVTTVRGGERFRGSHLRPWATRALFGDPSRLVERTVPLRECVDRTFLGSLTAVASAGADEADRLLDRFWSEVATEAAPLDDLVAEACLEIMASGGGRPIGEIAERVGLSARQLRRRFRAAVGLSPKEFARVRRVRRATVDLVKRTDGSWTDRAALAAFSDQAHLVREYREMFGASPKRVEDLLGRISHGRLLV